MTPLEKIEKLLVNDEMPNQYLVDYKIDKIIDDMIEAYIHPKIEHKNLPNLTFTQEPLINEKKGIYLSSEELVFFAKQKCFSDVLNSINKSLNRYSPHVSLDDRCEYQTEFFTPMYDDYVTSMSFTLKLNISPEMKQVLKLNRDLEVKENKASRPKI